MQKKQEIIHTFGGGFLEDSHLLEEIVHLRNVADQTDLTPVRGICGGTGHA